MTTLCNFFVQIENLFWLRLIQATIPLPLSQIGVLQLFQVCCCILIGIFMTPIDKIPFHSCCVICWRKDRKLDDSDCLYLSHSIVKNKFIIGIIILYYINIIQYFFYNLAYVLGVSDLLVNFTFYF